MVIIFSPIHIYIIKITENEFYFNQFSSSIKTHKKQNNTYKKVVFGALLLSTVSCSINKKQGIKEQKKN